MSEFYIRPEFENRLRRAAAEAGLQPDAVLQDAILSYLDDLEDYQRGTEVLRRNEPTITLDELERKLGLED